MQDHRRYRIHGESMPMMTTRDSSTRAKLKTATENKSARHRRPPTLKEMNAINRAFWSRKENQQ